VTFNGVFLKVGVIGVQGAIEEHLKVLSGLVGKQNSVRVKTREDLEDCQALIIPCGESTTISRLMQKNGLVAPLIEKIKAGTPVMGTCAGLIVLAAKGDTQVKKTRQKLLGVLDVTVKRNAFGRQKDSFEAFIDVPVAGKKLFPGVFIRAPAVEKVLNPNVKVLCRFQDRIVGVQQDNVIAFSFHPELSRDNRIHEYFLSLA
jgi:5'-phosphate synthase pdxT subunit